MSRDEIGRSVPVHVVTGFLGSGKTTFLAKRLRGANLEGTAVLINEFGEIPLDHALVRPIDEQTVVLGNGCVCCGVRGELKSALLALLRLRDEKAVGPLHRIVVETSGLAVPAPILATLRLDPVLRHQVRPGSTTAIVDAVHMETHRTSQPEWSQQVAAADLVVLSKGDLVDRPRREQSVSLVHALNPMARIMMAGDVDRAEQDGSLSWPVSLPDTPGVEPDLAPGANSDRDVAILSDTHHRHDIGSVGIHTDLPVDWARFGTWLSLMLHAYGERILRTKCLIAVEGMEGPVFLQGVQHVVHEPVHLPSWPDDDRRSRIVMIARDMDPAAIRASFEACVLNVLPHS